MIQKYTVTAEGEGRLDIVSRISMLFMQRHIEKMMYETSEWMLKAYGIFEA